MIFENNYKLIGNIYTPFYEYYNGIIIGLLKYIKILKIGFNYFNVGRIQNSKIIHLYIFRRIYFKK